MDAKEKWLLVEEYPGYEISDRGRVRRAGQPDRILRPKGYLRVSITHEGRAARPSVHRLVADTFFGHRPGMQVNHKNGDTTDNRVQNLEWVTSRQNQIHAIENGLYGARGEKHGRAKLTEAQVREIRRRYTGEYGQQGAMAREYGVSQALIAKVVRGAVWTHL